MPILLLVLGATAPAAHLQADAPPAPGVPLAATVMEVYADGYGNGDPTKRYDHDTYAHTQNAQRSTTPRIVSGGGYQFTAFLDKDGTLVVAKRELAKATWTVRDTGLKPRIPNDYHGAPSIGIDAAGYLHISWDQHHNALRYIRSAAPYSITSWVKLDRFDGVREGMVTYPHFFQAGGALFVHYREGGAAEANLILKRYEPATQAWWTVQGPFLYGYQPPAGPREGAYWTLEANPHDGSLHLLWAWNNRDAGDTRDLSYARSADGGAWSNLAGQPLPDPMLQSDRPLAVVRPGPVLSPAEGNARLAFTADGTMFRVVASLGGNALKLELLALRDGAASFTPLATSLPPTGGTLVSLLEDAGALYAVYQPLGAGALMVGRSVAPYDAWTWRPVALPAQGVLTWDVDVARWDAERTLSLYVTERMTTPYLDAPALQRDPGGWMNQTMDGSADRMGPATSGSIYVVDVPDLPRQFESPVQ